MRDPRVRVRMALAHAPEIGPADPIPHVYASGKHLIANVGAVDFRFLDDYEPIPINMARERSLNSVETRDVQEFEALLDATAAEVDMPNRRSYVLETLIHERAHYQMWLALGSASTSTVCGIQYAYVVSERRGRGITFAPYVTVENLILPKLALAAVAAAPYRPSDDDLRTVRNLGYTLPELGNKIHAHNTAGYHPSIPMPHSISFETSSFPDRLFEPEE